MTARKRARPIIKPSEYATFIEQIDIANIGLVSASAARLGDAERLSNSIMDIKTKAWYENGQGEFRVFHRYNMNIKNAETRGQTAKLSAVFVITYRSELPLTEEIFEIFKGVNLPLNTWPYFRELAHNTFSRMNLPQIIAPAFKLRTKI